jgi:CBS domain containing-hemolysin-like protein
VIFSALFWLAAAGLSITLLASIGARSLTEFSRHDLEEICSRRKSHGRLGQILKQYDQVALAAETFRVVGSAALIAAATLWMGRDLSTPTAAGWATFALTLAGGALLLLAVSIWIPWAVSRLWAEPFIYYTWPAWQALGLVLGPLALGARFVDVVFHRLVGRVPEVPDEESFEDEIRTIVTEGHREGLLEEDAREMIEGVIELSDLVVSEIMTPRTDMVSMPLSCSWSEALEFAVKVGHTRIPVYDKNRDDIVGVL